MVRDPRAVTFTISLAMLGACAHSNASVVDRGPATCEPAIDYPGPRDYPAREEILNQMMRIKAEVEECMRAAHVPRGATLSVAFFTAGQTGRAKFASGEVASTSEAIDFQQLDACVDRAFAPVCFQPFATESFRVNFPFRIQ